MDLRTANVTRYILPLREGGSLPALAEADDEFKYVVKFNVNDKAAVCCPPQSPIQHVKYPSPLAFILEIGRAHV